MDCAVYYLAADKDEQVVRLAFSLATLREVYDGRVFVISDRGGQIDAAVKMFDVELIRAGYPEHIKQHVDRRFRSRWHKTQLLKCVRTKAGIFLDTDTLVLRDPQEGWDYLPPGKLFGIVCPNQQSIGAIKDDVENLQKRLEDLNAGRTTGLDSVNPPGGVQFFTPSEMPPAAAPVTPPPDVPLISPNAIPRAPSVPDLGTSGRGDKIEDEFHVVEFTDTDLTAK